MDDWIGFFPLSDGQKTRPVGTAAAFINLDIDPTDAVDA
jgi:hypothetical protein